MKKLEFFARPHLPCRRVLRMFPSVTPCTLAESPSSSRSSVVLSLKSKMVEMLLQTGWQPLVDEKGNPAICATSKGLYESSHLSLLHVSAEAGTRYKVGNKSRLIITPHSGQLARRDGGSLPS